MMPPKGVSLVYLVFLILALKLTPSHGQDASITVTLNKNLTWADKELFGGYIAINSSGTLELKLADPNKSVAFIILQVHSFMYNVRLYNNTLTPQSTVVGTDIGLYSSVKPTLDTFYIKNENSIAVVVYVSIHGYERTDPIPGGCNMEFPSAISPYIRIDRNDDFALVDVAPAMDSKDPNCKSVNDVTVVFYMMYLPERNLVHEHSYFRGILNMLTLDNILQNGKIIPENSEHMRRRMATYYGMPVAYVAVAYSNTNKDAYSVYIPTIVFNCNPLKLFDCLRLHEPFHIVICLVLTIGGSIICFWGQKFFKTALFLSGTVSGTLVSYIVASLIAIEIEPFLILTMSLILGLVCGVAWVLFWWFFGMPLVSVYLPALNVGFLIAAVVYYFMPGGLVPMQSDLNFWMLFITIAILASVAVLVVPTLSNMLCCSILGAYAFVFAMGYAVGTNLNYIIINAVRRAVLPDFNKAILAPPMTWPEFMEVFSWVSLAFVGVLYQHRNSYGRPPFPPPPRNGTPSILVAAGHSYGAIVQNGWRRVNNLAGSRNPSTVNKETAPLLA